MSDKKKTGKFSRDMMEHLSATVTLIAGDYSRAALLEIAMGFPGANAEQPDAPDPPATEIDSNVPVTKDVDAKEAAAVMAEALTIVPAAFRGPYPRSGIPIGPPSITLFINMLAWLRNDESYMKKAIDSLFSEGKNPKIKKTLTEFVDVVGKMPVSDSSRWMLHSIVEASVTSTKAVHEALAEINDNQLVNDLTAWGLSMTGINHSTDAALAASRNDLILAIVRGERGDVSGYGPKYDHDAAKVNAGRDANPVAFDPKLGVSVYKATGKPVHDSAADDLALVAPKTPDDVIEPLGFGPPGEDLVESHGVLVRENDVQKDVTPKKKIPGSASAVVRALVAGCEKLGTLKCLQFADKLQALTAAGEPNKGIDAVVKLLGMVDEADNAAVLRQLVDDGCVTIEQIESVFKDEWQGLYTSLCDGLRTTGPRPAWINDGLASRKTS